MVHFGDAEGDHTGEVAAEVVVEVGDQVGESEEGVHFGAVEDDGDGDHAGA